MGSMFKSSPPPEKVPMANRNPMETAEQFKARRKQYRNPVWGQATSILGGGDGTDEGSPPSGEGGIGSPL